MRSNRNHNRFTTPGALQAKRETMQRTEDHLQKLQQRLHTLKAEQATHQNKLALIPQRLLDIELQLAQTQTEADRLQVVIDYLDLRSSNWLLQNRFQPGTGTFQERINALIARGMQIDIPEDFICQLTKNTILNKPLRMTGTEKGAFTYIDQASYLELKPVQINPHGRKLISGEQAGFRGAYYRCNPFTNVAFTDGEPEIDKEFQEQIETFVIVHELQAYLQSSEDQRLLEIQRCYSRASAIAVKLPALHQHTNDLIADNDIPLHKKVLPRYFRSNLFNKSYMSFPIRINEQWSIDFYDLIQAQEVMHHAQQSRKPLTSEEVQKLADVKEKRIRFCQSNIERNRKLTKAAIESIRQNIGNKFWLLNEYQQFLPADPQTRRQEEQRINNLSIAELKCELEDKLQLRLHKHESNYEKSIAEVNALTYADICDYDQVTHYNPFVKDELKPIQTLMICYEVLQELDKEIEKALHAAIPDFQQAYASIHSGRDALLRKRKSLQSKTKTIPIKLKLLEDEALDVEKSIQKMQAEKIQHALDIKIEEARINAERADDKLRLEPELSSYCNTSFMEIIAEYAYPTALLPALLQNNPYNSQSLTLITHPILLDNQFLIDLKELEQFWHPARRLFGLWQPADQYGINPFTMKPIQSINYASELRELSVSFLRHIDKFREIIAEFKSTDIKNLAENVALETGDDEDALQATLCNKLEKVSQEDKFKQSLLFTVFNSHYNPEPLDEPSRLCNRH